MAVGAPGGTSFTEDDTSHLGPGTPKVLGSHLLEVCPTIDGGPRHTVRSRAVETRSRSFRQEIRWNQARYRLAAER